MIKLTPRRSFRIPVKAECITPDTLAEKPLNEVAILPLWEGNQKRTLSELFKIEKKPGTSDNPTVQIVGDVGKVRRIGAEMTTGTIIVEGNAGMHLGEKLNGGTIIVKGNAGSWAGCMMKKGTIEIMGNAGDYIGAAYRGSTGGMRGGTIIIHGNAGNEVGCFMRKGLIKIYGNIGQFAGIHMKKGTIFVKGNSEGRAGAEMIGGKVVLCGHIPSILPSFTIDSIKSSVKIDGEKVGGPFYRFVGDLTENGDGKLFVSQEQNTHLKSYERFL